MNTALTTSQGTLPKPEEVMRRIVACREELAALRKLYRAAVAARQAEEARQRKGASQ